MPLTPIRQVVMQIYPFFEAFVPGLSVFAPRDALLGIVDSIEIGIKEELKVDVKFRNMFEILGVVSELAQAALLRTPKERREAIWALLEFITDIETKMTMDEFMVYASQVKLPDET